MKFRNFVPALSIAVAACGGAGSAPANGAGDESAALVQAGQALEAKLGAPGEKSQMPAADDAAVKAFDAQAEKGLADLGTPAMPVAGLDSYDRLCGSSAKIVAAYVSAGLGPVQGGLPMDDKAKSAKMTENANRYLNQMFTPLLFSAHCTAVHLPAIEKALGGQDLSGKAGAIAQVRGGAFGQAHGLLQMAGSGDIDAVRRKKVLDLLVRDAGNFAVVLNQAQRQELAQQAQQIGQAMPDTRAQTDKIASALTGSACGKLCSI